MNSNSPHSQAAYRFANDGLGRILAWAGTYITDQRQSLEQANRAEIRVLQTKQGFLLDTWRELLRQDAAVRQREQPPGVPSGAWSLSVAICLTLGAFLIALKILEPFGLGWMGWVFCLALAIALPYSIDRFLQDFRRRTIVRIIISAALAMSLATALLFGMLRGDILARMLEGEAPVEIAGIDVQAEVPTKATDGEQLAATLRRVWGLAALAFELAAGLALYDFREGRRIIDFGSLRRLQKELMGVEKELLRVSQRLHQLLSQPASLEAAFWADFERGLQDGGSRPASVRRLGCWALGIFLTATAAQAADKLHTVALIDLSKTQEAKNYSGTAEFNDNLRAVSTILTILPAGSRATMIGITDRSYINPLVLLDARTSLDAGVFASRLKSAHQTLMSEWRKLSRLLKPSFKETDLLGALRYAGEVLARSEAQRKVVVILSDGRQYSAELDLESPKTIDVAKSLSEVEKQGLFVDLKGVEVFFFGAGDHSGKRGTHYTLALRVFWTAFIERSGGTLKVFSTTRDGDALRAVTSLPATKTGLP
jgi:hypothetical protein